MTREIEGYRDTGVGPGKAGRARRLTWGAGNPSQDASTRQGRMLGRRSRWKYHRRFQKMMGWVTGSSGIARTSLPSFSTKDSSSFRSTRGLRYAQDPPSIRLGGVPCQKEGDLSHHVHPLLDILVPAPIFLLLYRDQPSPKLDPLPLLRPLAPALTPICPLQSWGSSRARQSLRSLSTGPGPPGTGASLLLLVPMEAGWVRGALWRSK